MRYPGSLLGLAVREKITIKTAAIVNGSKITVIAWLASPRRLGLRLPGPDSRLGYLGRCEYVLCLRGAWFDVYRLLLLLIGSNVLPLCAFFKSIKLQI